MTPARPAAGVALVVVMVVFFSGMETTIRWLGSALPVLLMLCARYLFQAATMAFWLLADRRQSFRSAHPRFQALRGVLLLLSSVFSFIGLQYLPLAEFTAMNMLAPVLVTLLAAVLLKERVSALRWALVGGGLVGALIVIRPGSGLFGWAVLFPLGCASSYAAFQVLSSRLAALESPYTTHFWTGFAGCIVLLPLLALSTLDVSATLARASAAQLGLLVLIGFLGTSGHLMLILALRLAPAATLTPFMYLQLAAAAGFGWLVFARLPDRWSWIGIGVIGACGAASAWLNVRAAGARAQSPVVAETAYD